MGPPQAGDGSTGPRVEARSVLHSVAGISQTLKRAADGLDVGCCLGAACCIAAHVTRTQGGTPSPHFPLIPTPSACSPRRHPDPSAHREDLWPAGSRDAAIECLNSTLASAKQQPASATRRNPSSLIHLWPAALTILRAESALLCLLLQLDLPSVVPIYNR